MTRYEQGFIMKCAEYGVDPEWLVKAAGNPATKFVSQVFRKALASGASRQEAMRLAQEALAKSRSALASGASRSAARNAGMRKIVSSVRGNPTLRSGLADAAELNSVGRALARNASKRTVGIANEAMRSAAHNKSIVNEIAAREAKVKADRAASQAALKARLKAKYGDRLAAGATSSATGSVKPPVGPAAASGATSTTVGATPAATNLAASTAPAEGALAEGRPGFLSRFFNLLRGGNKAQLAREYGEYSKGSRDFLKMLEGRADATADPMLRNEMYRALDRSRISTATETARRLQNLNSESNKVLAARLGTGAGVLGSIGLGASLYDDSYTPQVAEPWQQWGMR